MSKPMTLAFIEAVTASSIDAAEPRHRKQNPETHYLGVYGITNPWGAWILKQDSRLLALTSNQIAGWADEWTEADEWAVPS